MPQCNITCWERLFITSRRVDPFNTFITQLILWRCHSILAPHNPHNHRGIKRGYTGDVELGTRRTRRMTLLRILRASVKMMIWTRPGEQTRWVVTVIWMSSRSTPSHLGNRPKGSGFSPSCVVHRKPQNTFKTRGNIKEGCVADLKWTREIISPLRSQYLGIPRARLKMC